MDDRDLEARLKAYLHQRFDGGEPSRELMASVQQALATRPGRIGLLGVRGRRPLGPGLMIAAGVAAVAVAIGGLAIGIMPSTRPNGPGVGASPSPTGAIGERNFVVLPPSARRPEKAESSLASEVLSARLEAFGVVDFAGAIGNVMLFTTAPVGPSGDAIRTVLAATGDVALVPLPPAAYGSRGLTAAVGRPLPRAEPALFGWEGIVSVARDTSSTDPVFTMTLKPAARQAFGDYTTANVGESFAILVDGVVATLSTIRGPITDGQLTITGGSHGGDAFTEAAAILVGGELPEAWRGAAVPTLISRGDGIAAALASAGGATVQLSGLDGSVIDGRWRAVWKVALGGSFPVLCPSPPSGGSCLPSATSELVVVDAVTGAVLSTEAPAPTP